MSKKIVIDALKHKSVQRPPWVVFTGIHAGKLLNYNAIEVLTEPNKAIRSIEKVNQLYRPDGQPILFDLQLEAEALGCDLYWAETTPPTVSSHPLKESYDLPKPIDNIVDLGRFPMVKKVMLETKTSIGESTALYGLICGPFTLASHLRGTSIFMDMYDNETYVKQLIAYCTTHIKQVIDAYIQWGMDVIAIVDPLISQISPSHFNNFLKKDYTDLFNRIRSNQRLSSFFVCGNATRNLEVMCQTHPDSISIDENINLKEAKNITDQYNICLGGNIPLTTVMLHGSQMDNMKYTIDMMDNLESPRKNYIVSPGCDMPYDTPLDNVIGVGEAIKKYDEIKELVKTYTSFDFSSIQIELPNYQRLDKPLIETFTLDSSSCAACTYMWNMTQDIKDHFKDKIDIVEYKYTQKENIARCQKMGVESLPSMYINGTLEYASIIPTKAELIALIEEKYIPHD
jgi:uroporphyrinogen decarboxylase